MANKMKCKCAWCGIDLGEPPANEESEKYPISHGICTGCANKMMQELGTSAQNFIDGFEQSIMLVDNLNNVILANEAARKESAINFENFDMPKCGEIIGCIHSHLSNGCGTTVHCEGCVIKRLILKTHETGLGYTERACKDQEFYNGVKHATLQITTEKVGSRILLKIDPIEE